MAGSTVCPGCRVELPVSTWEWDPSRHSSPECWQLYGDVTGFELNHVALMRLHQITVDAYGAQHVGGDGRGIRAAYSLVGLHLALDRGLTGLQVRSAHQQMGKPDATWPAFLPPPNVGALTVLDVAEAGVRADSVSGHADAIQRWAAEVWRAWSPQQAVVSALTDRLLARFLARLPRTENP
ncbi:MAG: DUF5946 family protein [Candidatus Dormibacteraeota bacterium]|nr:DUF5946 family protein [Candidatus Dormibacteraeota bacterium]